MPKFNGIAKIKMNDGSYLIRISDGDQEFDPMNEAEYRLSMIKPDFDNLPEGTWLPPAFRDKE